MSLEGPDNIKHKNDEPHHRHPHKHRHKSGHKDKAENSPTKASQSSSEEHKGDKEHKKHKRRRHHHKDEKASTPEKVVAPLAATPQVEATSNANLNDQQIMPPPQNTLRESLDSIIVQEGSRSKLAQSTDRFSPALPPPVTLSKFSSDDNPTNQGWGEWANTYLPGMRMAKAFLNPFIAAHQRAGHRLVDNVRLNKLKT